MAPGLPPQVVRLAMARILLAVAAVCIGVSYISVAWAVRLYYAILILYVLLARRGAQSKARGDTT